MLGIVIVYLYLDGGQCSFCNQVGVVPCGYQQGQVQDIASPWPSPMGREQLFPTEDRRSSPFGGGWEGAILITHTFSDSLLAYVLFLKQHPKEIKGRIGQRQLIGDKVHQTLDHGISWCRCQLVL